MSDWARFYAAAGESPRETLIDALERFACERRPPGTAVDLGAGTGRDTVELLRRGWRVIAVDAQPEAIARLRRHPDAVAHADALETVLARFEETSWSPLDLVNASFSLPFCPRDALEETWVRIRDSLLPGGRFCGQLFGVRDEWATVDGMTFLTRAEVEGLLAGLEVERFQEVDRAGRTAVGASKHWHLFHLVVRKL